MAKAKGVRFGRPAIEFPDNYESVIKDWREGKIKAVEAMKILNIKKTTFYKMIKKEN